MKTLEAHKTERGGVILGVANDAELRHKGCSARQSRSRAAHERGFEAIVGYRRDPVVGPVVLVGMGGVMTEIYRDYVLRIAPVSVEEGMEMIEQVKGFAAIRGFRNLPRGDVQALARAVSALSSLASVDAVEEAMNLILVKAEGIVAVDALVARRRA